jgi:endoglucanase
MSRKLSVLINMHHYNELMKDPDGHRQRFIALWEQISRHYQEHPATLSFELLNEPHDKLTTEKWNRLLNEAITVIRRTNPSRMIVVGPAGWNNIDGLEALDLPADQNVVATFHYYSPFRFTHQGASWVGGQSREWLGTKWLGTRAEKHAIVQHFDKAISWSVKHRRPLFLGEFGAYSKADIESRARWTRFVADQALSRKIGFAYWEFCASFGVYDASEDRWVAPLRDALLGSDPTRRDSAKGRP